MLLTVTLPMVNPFMASGLVQACYLAPGAQVVPGTRLLDFKVDLSAALSHDCPPISFHRLALRERAWLRRLLVAPGQDVAAGAVLALLSTDPEESLEGTEHRPARCSIAGILPQPDWWAGGAG